jgi:hypothetical protein
MAYIQSKLIFINNKRPQEGRLKFLTGNCKELRRFKIKILRLISLVPKCHTVFERGERGEVVNVQRTLTFPSLFSKYWKECIFEGLQTSK